LLVVQGIRTAVGGRTGHAAVVAREMGKVRLVGGYALSIDEGREVAELGGKLVHEGDFIALDGATGEVSLGLRRIVCEDPPETAIIRQWRKDGARQGV
jgi:pyruvate,orthophosphate dikinase